MLYTVTQLSKHSHGDIRRRLCNEENADALGADQADNLLDLFQQGLGTSIEEQVGFIKEENHFRFFQISHFRKILIQFGEHPKQEGRVHGRVPVEAVCCKQIDDALTVLITLHPVTDVQCGFTEETVAPLVFQNGYCTLNSANSCRCNIAILECVLVCMLTDIIQHGLKIFDIQKQHALIICHAEYDIEHTALRVVQAKHTAEHDRSHL